MNDRKKQPPKWPWKKEQTMCNEGPLAKREEKFQEI